MTKHPLALAVAFAFAASPLFSGCDRISGLSEEEHIQRAKDLEDRGDLKTSIIELKNALQKNPENAQARLLLGQIYLKQGLGADAEKELVRAQQLGVSSENTRLQIGEAWLLMGEFKRVLDELDPSAGTTPQGRATVLQMRGQALLGLRRFEDGCSLFEESITVDPKQVKAYLGLANCAIAKRDTKTARSRIEEAIRLKETDPEVWIALGNFERLENNPQKAADAYANALKHDSNNLFALFGRAQIFALSGRSSEAQDELAKIKAVSPDFYGLHFVQGVLLYSAGQTDKALESVQRALKAYPSFLPAQLLFAYLQYEKKSYENTARVLNQILQRAPGHIEARKLLAATYLRLDQPDRSFEMITPVVQSGKADAQTLALAGEVRLRKDDPAAAKEFFEQAAGLAPDSAALRSKVGLSLLAAGESTEAISELRASSAMDPTNPNADIALAYYFLAEKQFEKALQIVADIEKKLPNSPGTYNLKGMALAGIGNYGEARQSFERALALRPGLVSAAIRLAALDLQEKNIPAARSRYQSVLKHDSNNVPAMIGLAELAKLEKKDQEYLDWLERAAKVSPTAHVPRILLANHYLGTNQPQKALALAREAVNGQPGSADSLGALGRAQLALGDTASALSTYTKLVALAPNSAYAHYEVAQVHAARGDAKATRAALRKAIALKPDYVDALAALSGLETRAGTPADAISLARQVQALTSTAARGYRLEGDALLVQRRYVEASGAYAKALSKEPDSRLAIKRHQALLNSGDSKQADRELLDWIKAHSQDQVSRAYLADSYLKRGRTRDAIQQYELLLSAVPDNAMVINNLAVLYQQSKDPRALPMAEKGYKSNPESATHADTLGWILVQQGQAARGLQLLEKAVAGAPNDAEVRFHYAYALANSGQTVLARQELAKLRSAKLSPALEQQVDALKQRLP